MSDTGTLSGRLGTWHLLLSDLVALLGEQGRQSVRPDQVGRADDDEAAGVLLDARLDVRNPVALRSTSSR